MMLMSNQLKIKKMGSCAEKLREPEQDTCDNDDDDDDDDNDDDVSAANRPSHPGDQAPDYWS